MSQYHAAVRDQAPISESPWAMSEQYETYSMTGDEYRWLREPLVAEFSWAIPDTWALELVAKLSPIVEVGAGSGYWAHELHRLGCNIVATDKNPGHHGRDGAETKLWCDVASVGATTAARAYSDRALLMVWPSYDDDWAELALRAYCGRTLVYVGEGYGGCTATDSFHELLAREWAVSEFHIPQWDGMHDRIHICERTDPTPDQDGAS